MSKSRVVIVTGGGSGMGRAIVHRFADAGDLIYIIGRRLEKLQETAKGYKNIKCIIADLTDTDAVEKSRDEIIQKHKTVDVLINSAGGNTKIAPDSSLRDVAKGWHDIIAKNLDSTFLMVTAFGPHLARPGGRIINISSTAALAGSTAGGANGQAYSAAKAGIHGLSMTLTYAYGSDGITVNTISPGVIDDTEFFGGSGVPEDRKQAYLSRIPLNRFGKPEEIAAGAFYLASQEAGFVTGEILNINGGMVFGR